MAKRSSEEELPIGQRQKREDSENEFSRAIRKHNHVLIRQQLQDGNIEPTQRLCKLVRPLDVAVQVDNVKMAKLFIEKGADVEASTFGTTPLALAASAGSLKCNQMLIDAGAKVDRQSQSLGMTAMMTAAMHGHDTIIYQLLMAGAKTSLKDWNGNDALYYAKESNSTNAIKLLEMDFLPPLSDSE